MLLRSWVRRKRFEARILAGELGRLFGSTGAGSGQGQGQRVSADAMMKMMGLKWH